MARLGRKGILIRSFQGWTVPKLKDHDKTCKATIVLMVLSKIVIKIDTMIHWNEYLVWYCGIYSHCCNFKLVFELDDACLFTAHMRNRSRKHSPNLYLQPPLVILLYQVKEIKCKKNKSKLLSSIARMLLSFLQ